jgi:hypothetical protein
MINKFLGLSWAIFYHFVFRLYLLILRLRARAKKKIFRNSNEIGECIQLGTIDKKVAIIAGYPIGSPSYLLSLKRLVTGLLESENSIVCVFNNRPSSELLSILSDPQVSIFVRKNSGRDFACYQAGIRYLINLDSFNSLSELILVNDTLYWFESSRNVIQRLRKHEWSCLYLNLEKHTHAQSFLLRFDTKVINSMAFQNFWKDYLPLNAKRHLIHRGEIALTTELLSAGFNVFPIVNPELLDAAEIELNPQMMSTLARIPLGGLKPVDSVPVLPSSLFQGTFHLYMSIGNSEDKISNHEILLQDNVLDYFDWLKNFVFSDPPHRIGLHISLLFNFPMKRDMYKFIHLTPIANSIVELAPEIYESIMLDQTSAMTKFMRGDFKSRLKRKMGEH